MSLLEERIKRSSRKTTVLKPELETTVIKNPISPQKENSPNKSNISNSYINNENNDQNDDVEEEEESLPPVM